MKRSVPSAGGTLQLAVASGLGLGLSPVAPGTCGALLGVAIHWAIVRTASADLVAPLVAIALLAVSTVHWVLTPFAVRYWRDADPRHFVLDEVAGYLVVPLVCPNLTGWRDMVAGFVLFRVFDVVKLPPARQIDREVKGAAGILLDDLVSGVFAGALLCAWRHAMGPLP